MKLSPAYHKKPKSEHAPPVCVRHDSVTVTRTLVIVRIIHPPSCIAYQVGTGSPTFFQLRAEDSKKIVLGVLQGSRGLGFPPQTVVAMGC